MTSEIIGYQTFLMKKITFCDVHINVICMNVFSLNNTSIILSIRYMLVTLFPCSEVFGNYSDIPV